MNFQIRKARRDEWGIIRELNQMLFNEEKKNGHDEILDLNWPQGEIAEKYFHKAINSSYYLVLIAEDDNGRALGYLIGCSKNKFGYRQGKTGELENMLVASEARRQGVGKMLVRELRKWCKAKGVDRVYVEAYFKNLRAQHFYKAVGFIPMSLGLEMRV